MSRIGIACVTIALGVTPSAAAPAVSPSSIAVCHERTARDPRSLDAWRCYLRWARRGPGEADHGRRHLESALAADPGNHSARFILASIESDQGRERAETLFLSAIAGFESRRDVDGHVHARLGLAYFLGRRGRLDESESQIERATETAASGGEELAGWVSVSRAWARYERSDYAGAEAILRAAEAAIFPDGVAPLRSTWLSAMGAALWGMGRLPEALAAYRRQAELLRASGDRFEEAAALANVTLLTASIYGSSYTPEQYQEMLRQTREVEAAAIAGGNRSIEGTANSYIAQLLPPGAERRRRSERTVALLAEFRSAAYRNALRTLAIDLAYSEPRDLERAFRLLDEAQAMAVAHGDLQGVARGAVVRVTALWSEARKDGADPALRAAARAAVEPALDAIEAIRDRQHDAEVKARTFASWVFAYDRLAGYLLESSDGDPAREDIEAAFSVMERRRARVLLEELELSGAGGTLAVSGPAGVRRREILGRIGGTLATLRGGLAEADRAAAVEELNRLSAEEAVLRAKLAKADPRFGAWRGAIAGLDEIEAALGEKEAMLSFQTADSLSSAGRFEGGSSLLAHTSKGTRLYSLPDEKALDVSVGMLVGLIEAGEPAADEAGDALYKSILDTALADLPPSIDRLILITDGPLDRLPFAALRPTPRAEPLGLRYRMSRAFSATSWLRIRQGEARPPEAPLLALADPSTSGADDIPRSPLPFARWESRAASRHLGRGGLVLVGAAATEAALREAAPGRFAILHIAAHALADPTEPSRSAVLLGARGSDDGRLTMAEIADLGLDDRTVVLAACRSASGPQLQGEGVMSLARAFFASGARAVVGSLWELKDEEAASLLDRLYLHLGRGVTLDDALLRARRDRAAQGAAASTWAGFEIFGDAAQAPLAGGRRARLAHWHLAALAALASGASAARALWLRRRPTLVDGPPTAYCGHS